MKERNINRRYLFWLYTLVAPMTGAAMYVTRNGYLTFAALSLTTYAAIKLARGRAKQDSPETPGGAKLKKQPKPAMSKPLPDWIPQQESPKPKPKQQSPAIKPDWIKSQQSQPLPKPAPAPITPAPKPKPATKVVAVEGPLGAVPKVVPAEPRILKGEEAVAFLKANWKKCRVR